MTPTELYGALCAPFANTQSIKKGGADLTYIPGEAVTSRLNDTLGLDGWDFRILGNGRDEDAVWVHGQLTVYLAERTIVREQFGECQSNRGMAIGDARKGAATDCLKKCASLIGVGLYLSSKEDQRDEGTRSREAEGSRSPASPIRPAAPPRPAPAQPPAPRPTPPRAEPDQLEQQRQIRERLMDGWAALWNKAQQLGLKVDPVDVTRLSNAQLSDAGTALKARVEAEMDRIEAAG